MATCGYRSMTAALVACATLSTVTFAAAYPAGADRTFATSDCYGPGIYSVTFYSPVQSIDMSFLDAPAPSILAVDRRGYPAHRVAASKTRQIGAAVLATTQGGVMSGRLRRLSG